MYSKMVGILQSQGNYHPTFIYILKNGISSWETNDHGVPTTTAIIHTTSDLKKIYFKSSETIFNFISKR
jgi:hypothetical protein